MNPYRYRVALRAIHPRDDLRPLFDQLGLSPERTWRAGERRTSPAGIPLDGVYRESYAYTNLTHGSRNWSDEDLQDYLRGIQQRLAMHHIRRGLERLAPPIVVFLDATMAVSRRSRARVLRAIEG